MRWVPFVLMISVTACGSASTQGPVPTCPDGGDPFVCVAQPTMSPEAAVQGGGAPSKSKGHPSKHDPDDDDDDDHDCDD